MQYSLQQLHVACACTYFHAFACIGESPLSFEPPNGILRDLPSGLVVKNLPAMQEMQVQSLGQEDLLEKEMATYSSILAWKIQWTEEPGGLQSMRLQILNMT